MTGAWREPLPRRLPRAAESLPRRRAGSAGRRAYVRGVPSIRSSSSRSSSCSARATARARNSSAASSPRAAASSASPSSAAAPGLPASAAYGISRGCCSRSRSDHSTTSSYSVAAASRSPVAASERASWTRAWAANHGVRAVSAVAIACRSSSSASASRRRRARSSRDLQGRTRRRSQVLRCRRARVPAGTRVPQQRVRSFARRPTPRAAAPRSRAARTRSQRCAGRSPVRASPPRSRRRRAARRGTRRRHSLQHPTRLRARRTPCAPRRRAPWPARYHLRRQGRSRAPPLRPPFPQRRRRLLRAPTPARRPRARQADRARPSRESDVCVQFDAPADGCAFRRRSEGEVEEAAAFGQGHPICEQEVPAERCPEPEGELRLGQIARVAERRPEVVVLTVEAPRPGSMVATANSGGRLVGECREVLGVRELRGFEAAAAP